MRTVLRATWYLVVLAAVTLFQTSSASAKESIESVRLDYANYRNHTSIGGTIKTEVPVYGAEQRIFFVAGLSGASISQTRGASYDNIGVELGLKYHLFPVTSIAVVGSHDWFSGSPNFTIAAAHVRLRQAFQPEDAPVVPFVRAHGILQFLDPVRESPARQDRNYRLLVVEAMGGVEVRMRKNFRWVLEGGRSQSKAVNNAGPDLADGWIGRIAMQYDWF